LVFAKYWVLQNIRFCLKLAIAKYWLFAKYWFLPNISFCQILAFAKHLLCPNIGVLPNIGFCQFFIFVVVVVFWLDHSKIDARPIVVYLVYGLSHSVWLLQCVTYTE
jgi:hypothetical protein